MGSRLLVGATATISVWDMRALTCLGTFFHVQDPENGNVRPMDEDSEVEGEEENAELATCCLVDDLPFCVTADVEGTVTLWTCPPAPKPQCLMQFTHTHEVVKDDDDDDSTTPYLGEVKESLPCPVSAMTVWVIPEEEPCDKNAVLSDFLYDMAKSASTIDDEVRTEIQKDESAKLGETVGRFEPFSFQMEKFLANREFNLQAVDIVDGLTESFSSFLSSDADEAAANLTNANNDLFEDARPEGYQIMEQHQKINSGNHRKIKRVLLIVGDIVGQICVYDISKPIFKNSNLFDLPSYQKPLEKPPEAFRTAVLSADDYLIKEFPEMP